MDATPSPVLMVSSAFLPTGSLVESLIHISNEVSSMDSNKFPAASLQSRNIATITRKIKLLSSLFEDIGDSNSPLPPSSILCLTELFTVIRRVKLLIQECKEGSSLWNLLQSEIFSKQFQVLVKEMGMALDILPLSLINITADVREQVELLRKQIKRADVFVDPLESHRREELLQLMSNNNENKYGNKRRILDSKKQVEEIMRNIGLRNPSDYEEEILKLEGEAHKQAGTGGLIVVSNINNLISLVSYSKSMIFGDAKHDEKITKLKDQELMQSSLAALFTDQDSSASSSQSMVLNIPDEFRCPISLDLMRDPVIVASGHTYDRNSIAEWINSGHHTCPKSGQKLIHMALIPNYALKCLIHQWCQENNVPLTSESSSDLERSTSKRKLMEHAVDHISASKAAIDAVKMTAEFLVGKLATGSPEIQRQAAYQLRLLAKTGMINRRIIAEAGAIPFLVTLLSAQDPQIQENAVTTLLNLSIFDNNKVLIMSAGAIDNIIEVLQSGKTMEARENAAAAIFSLSMMDDCKVTIGARPRAIPALVGLLREGTTVGKRDAATALFNLAIYNANKANVVVAGAVPLLIELLMDDKAGITDDALAVLALLSGNCEGLEEIKENRVVVPLLIDLLRFGSPKGKENSVTLLLGLCKNGGEEVSRRLLIHPHSIPSLQRLISDGSLKARRKAEALLKYLNRHCFQPHHSLE
ncbi:Armadillo [Macleaya cordata]|uniref:RING-type E3 ubiquitin transferase n=1 Tax=Macleaya cordata TaxID=56857 RepID=A0A200PWZ5_MACCD|nr:Armadillo [Macleaya cordata]